MFQPIVNAVNAVRQFRISIINPITTFLHHTMMVLGIAAITALAIMFFKPHLTNEFQAISPFFEVANAAPEPVPVVTESDKTASPPENNRVTDLPTVSVAHNPPSRQQKSVTNWLSKRYRVANDAAHMLVSAAYDTANELKLDPLLILSVMAIESGLNPFAESAVGAQGLMQVMSKIHHDKFADVGGIKAALDPVANIRVGAQILKEYVTRGGSVEAGLKMYVGAALHDNDGGYGSKVLAEYKRLKDVSNGKSVPTFTTATAPVAAASTKPAVVQSKVINAQKNNDSGDEKAAENHIEPEHQAAI